MHSFILLISLIQTQEILINWVCSHEDFAEQLALMGL